MHEVTISKFIDFSPLYESGFISISFWTIALIVSLLWGIDGVRFDLEEGNKKNSGWKFRLKLIGIFVSDTIGSLLGWGALYLLLASFMVGRGGVFEIFLGIVALAGITGFGYRLSDWLGKETKK